MAEKILNTRIRLKYDSLKNWTDKNTLLLQGEVAIAYLADSHTTTSPDNGTHPVLMKVGPGNFNNLPWMSALAADVHAWAKQSKTDFMNNFLAMEDDNGESMQKKLDTVFASNDELTQAIGDFQNALTETLKNYYAKDEVDAITGDLSKLNTENKGNLVSAINEALQAVEVGGTGSVVTVADQSGADSIKFVVKQGGNAVSVPIEFGAGDGLDHGTASATAGVGTIPTIKLSDATKASLAKADTALQEHQSLDHKADKVTGATAGNFAGLDANGNLTDSGKKAADFAPAAIDTGVHSVSLTGGTDNGTLKLIVDGAETDKIAVTGLKSAAYETVENLNAIAKEYADAVENKLPTSANYGVLSVAKGDDTITIGGDAQHPTIAVTPNTFDDYGAAAAVLGQSTDAAAANTVYGAKAAAAAAQNDATIAKTKIETFLGTVTPDGSQAIIDTLTEINDYVGEHGEEFATLSGKVANIENGTTATTAGDLTAALEAEIKGYTVANATKAADADQLGGQAPAYYATAASVTDITKDNGTIDTKIKAVTDTLGDLATKDVIVEGDISGTIAATKITNFATEVAGVKVNNATNADNATKATQDADGNVITATYATKAEVGQLTDTKYDLIAGPGGSSYDGAESGNDNTFLTLYHEGDHTVDTSVQVKGKDGLEVATELLGDANEGNTHFGITVKIADNGVTTAKIADKAITEAKLADEVIAKYATKEEVSNQDAVVLSEAQKYADGLASNYATADQGAAADTAVQSISTPAGANGEPNGLKAEKTGTDVAISFDDSVVFVFNCGTASEVI
jgi:hypothetical protein